MQLSRDQVNTILKNAPVGADKKQILDGLITRGYELEGVDTNAAKKALAPKQPVPVQPTPGFSQELTNRASKIGDIVSSVNKDTPVLKTSLDIANQIVGAPAAALYKSLPEGVQNVGNAVAENVIAKPIQKLTDFISESPTLQKFVMDNPDKAKQLEDIFGNVAAASELVGNATALSGVPKPISSTADNLTRLVGKTMKSAAKSTQGVLGTGLQRTGEKIQMSVIRPSVKDVSDGFKIENIEKYDVGGSLPETIAKTHTKMNELSNQLREKLAENPAARVDLNTILKETTDSLMSGKTKSFGDNQAIKRVIENLKEEIAQAAEDGVVDLVDATNIKRAAGTKGAWAYNRPEMDASAIEKVYTEFYDKMKTAIETNAPEGVKEINRQISELIPVNNAAMRRLPVAERNNAMSLTDTIGLTSAIFDPKALLIMGATIASKSGRVGNVLVKAGKAVKNAKLEGDINLNPDVKVPGALPGYVNIGGEVKDVSRLVDRANPYSGAAALLDDVDRKPMYKLADAIARKEAITKQMVQDADSVIEKINTAAGKQLINPNGTDLSKLKQITLLREADDVLTKKAIAGYDKAQAKLGAQKKSPISDDLVSEAKKYKSAEDFVKAKTNAYHGTDKVFEKFDLSKVGTTQKLDKYGMFFTSDKQTARNYSSLYPQKSKVNWTPQDKINAEKAIVMDAFIKDSDALTFSEVIDLYEKGKIKTKVKSEGFVRPSTYFDMNRDSIKEAMEVTGKDVFKITKEGETFYMVNNPDKMMSKSQLTEIWNKANNKN